MLQQLKKFKAIEVAALAILLTSAVFVLFYRLGAEPIQSWDEGYYAVVADNTGLSLVPKLDGKPLLEKPPLGIWLEAASMKIFESPTFGLRFPAALFSLGSFILLFLLGKKLGSVWIGFFASLLLLLSPLFLHPHHMARTGDLDTMLMFTVIGTFYFYICSWTKPKLLIWSGVMIGLGVMLRGSPLAIFAGIIFLHWIISKGWKHTPFRYWLWAFVAACVIALPWHIYMTIVFGYEFIRTYLFSSVVGRAFAVIDGHDGGIVRGLGPFSYYYDFLKLNFGWLMPLTYIVTLWLLWKGFVKKEKVHLLIALWIVITFVILFSMKTKIYWYLMPVLPAFYLGYLMLVQELYTKKKWLSILLAIAISISAIQGFWNVKANVFNPPTTSTIKSVAAQISAKGMGPEVLVSGGDLEMGESLLFPDAEWYLNREYNLNAKYLDFEDLPLDSQEPLNLITDANGLAALKNASKNYDIISQVDHLYIVRIQ